MSMILEYIAEKSLDFLIKTLINTAKDRDFNVLIKKEDIEKALNYHLAYVKNWCKSISIRDMLSPKETRQQYVELDIYLNPRKWSFENIEKETFSIYQLIQREFNSVIVGNPGAGKTTTVKYICNKMLFDNIREFRDFSFPILIELRRLEPSELIYDRLKNIFGIIISPKKVIDPEKNNSDLLREIKKQEKSIVERIINEYLNSLSVVLLIDGLDEVSEDKKNQVIAEIRDLFLHQTHSKIILTCRTGAYDYNLENSEVFELCELNDKQIEVFANKWFNNNDIKSEFLQKIKNTPYYKTSVRPLILTLLCAIFEKYKDIPEEPRYIYRRIVDMMIEQWDQERGIFRKSVFDNFNSIRKREFLSVFAFELTINFNSNRYTENQMEFIYKSIHEQFNLPKEESKLAIKEIESHNGLIINTSFDHFEFIHKSVQEYLCAEYLLGTRILEKDWIIKGNISNELAIAVCLSLNPSSYFSDLVINTFKKYNPNKVFIDQFIVRLEIENPVFKPTIHFICAVLLLNNLFYINKLNISVDENINDSKYKGFVEYLISKKIGREIFKEIKKYYYLKSRAKGVTLLCYLDNDYQEDYSDLPREIAINSNYDHLLH